MNSSPQKQKKAIKYYNRFAKIYDWVSSVKYYSKPREFAIKELENCHKIGKILFFMLCTIRMQETDYEG